MTGEEREALGEKLTEMTFKELFLEFEDLFEKEVLARENSPSAERVTEASLKLQMARNALIERMKNTGIWYNW